MSELDSTDEEIAVMDKEMRQDALNRLIGAIDHALLAVDDIGRPLSHRSNYQYYQYKPLYSKLIDDVHVLADSAQELLRSDKLEVERQLWSRMRKSEGKTLTERWMAEQLARGQTYTQWNAERLQKEREKERERSRKRRRQEAEEAEREKKESEDEGEEGKEEEEGETD